MERGSVTVWTRPASPPGLVMTSVTDMLVPPVRELAAVMIGCCCAPSVPMNRTAYGPPAGPVTATLPLPMFVSAANADCTLPVPLAGAFQLIAPVVWPLYVRVNEP